MLMEAVKHSLTGRGPFAEQAILRSPRLEFSQLGESTEGKTIRAKDEFYSRARVQGRNLGRSISPSPKSWLRLSP